jgi:hypothetical protein
MQETLVNVPPRVELKGSELFIHYTLSFFLLVPTVVAIYCLATNHYIRTAIPGMRILCLSTLAASLCFAWFQTRALRFRVIETSVSARENYQKVMAVIGKTDWRVSQHHIDRQIVAKVPGAVTWGERLEVRFHETYVYVNSICDPSRRFAFAALGDNLRHIAYIRNAVMGLADDSSDP